MSQSSNRLSRNWSVYVVLLACRHSMREFVVHMYIYNICKVKLLSFSNWPIMWLNFDKVEANCKWLFFRQSKHGLYSSLPLCWLRAMPSQTYVQPIAGIAAGQGQPGQMGSLVARWHLLWTCLDKMSHHTAHGIVAMTLRWTEEHSALPI